jgi:asparagine synthase (glutamine-hydrolysing)
MTFCSGSVLAKVDRMAMAHSLEVRAPFLDRRIVEWALTRRPEPLKRGEGKPLLRRYLAGRVPASVLTYPKQWRATAC